MVIIKLLRHFLSVFDREKCRTMSNNVEQRRTMSNNVEQCRTMSNNVEQCRTMSKNVEKCRSNLWGGETNNLPILPPFDRVLQDM